MGIWAVIPLIFAIFVIPMIFVIYYGFKYSTQKLPIIGGVYAISTTKIKVTVIKADRKTTEYKFKDPDDYNKIKEGVIKTSEFNSIFTYIDTDYKELIYVINKKS